MFHMDVKHHTSQLGQNIYIFNMYLCKWHKVMVVNEEIEIVYSHYPYLSPFY